MCDISLRDGAEVKVVGLVILVVFEILASQSHIMCHEDRDEGEE